MPELVKPQSALTVVTLDLQEGHLSEYGRRVLRGEHPADGVTAAARWLLSLTCASKSDYLENKNLDHNLGKAAFTMPATVALALCTVIPTDTSTGVSISEPTYTGYARRVISAAALNSAASGQTTTKEALTFAECTAGSSTIIGYAVCDNATKSAGNLLYWGTATSTVISTTQTPATIATGGLVVNED